jgi:type II secretory pathway pseudopilin PulG
MIDRKRLGVTLVELLVVLGISTLLAALILPTVKNLMIDRKSTQAATLVKNFLESARARSIGSGVPVAVVFERLSSTPSSDANGFLTTTAYGTGQRLVSGTATDPWPDSPIPADANFLPYNASIRLSFAEQPLPVTDEMIPGSSAAKTITAMIMSAAPSSIQKNGQDFYEIPLGGSNPILRGFLIAGSEISFKLSKSRHMITQTAIDNANNLWFTTVSRAGVVSTLEQSIPSTDGLTIGTSTSNFTIFPKPRPIVGPTLQLPKGMCVDLSLSGFATQGNNPSRDQRFRFSSEWLYARSAGPSAHELRPLYVVFTPDGGLSRVYTNGQSPEASALIPVESADDFFLHIGKIDQVVMPLMPADAIVPQNLTDVSNYIVRVSPKSGSIGCAPAANYETQAAIRGVTPASIGDIAELTRQNTFGASVTGQ